MRWILALAAFSLLSLPRTVFAEEGAGLASKDLVGAWDTATTDTKIRYDVQADGRYVRTVKVGWNSRQVGGTWRVEGDTVTILVDGDDEKITFRVRKVDDQNLDFWLKEDDQDEDATVRRWVRHDPDAKEPTPLDGRWELEEEELHWSLSLAPDGAYVFHRETRGNTVEDRGVWKALPGALTLMKDGKEDGLVHFNLRRLDDATLELTLGIRAGVPKTWKKGGDRQPPIVNAGQQLVGEWEVRGDTVSVYIKLEEDGRFLHEMKSPGSKETSKGTWKVEGDKLLAKPDDEAATYELTWKLLDENRLSLYDPDEKETTVLSRKGTEFKPPWGTLSAEAKKLVGTWMARSDSMELSIVLTADGSFKQALRTKEGTQVTEGVFNVERQEILIVVKGEAHVQRMPFKLDGDTLEIIEDGQVTAELVRQGT